MTLVEFLTARLNDDQRHAEKDMWAANRATVGDWTAYYGTNLPTSEIRVGQQRVARLESPFHEADALLVGRFKPSTVRDRAKKVLREVETKRRRLARHTPEDNPLHGTLCSCCSAENVSLYVWWPCVEVRDDAAVYDDHPEYQEAWRV